MFKLFCLCVRGIKLLQKENDDNEMLSRIWVTIEGVRIVFGFTGHLQIAITSNYKALANANAFVF
jgi:hypothetical protein